jgi:hypothetical protein
MRRRCLRAFLDGVGLRTGGDMSESTPRFTFDLFVSYAHADDRGAHQASVPSTFD